ncbi:MAG TPA: ATP-dependent Clp protease adaptor ClpS [Fimbriimonas sp.]
MGRLIGASAPGTIQRPEIEDIDSTGGHGWIVTVFDNDKNTWEEVMWILMFATGCDEQEAYTETWEVHHLGRSVVHHAGESECRRVARVIRQIGIRVEVSEE